MKTRLLTVFLLLTPGLAQAAELADDAGLLYPALKIVAALAIIIGLLYFFYGASRKGFGFLPKQREGSIKVLETKALGGRKFLCLVTVRGEEMLLGISNERIECLGNLPSRSKAFDETLEKQLEEVS